MHGRLLTNIHKHRLGLGAPFCHHCDGIVESMLHVLQDCPRACNVWLHWVPPANRVQFFMEEIDQWVDNNLSMSLDVGNVGDCPVIWANNLLFVVAMEE